MTVSEDRRKAVDVIYIESKDLARISVCFSFVAQLRTYRLEEWSRIQDG